MKLQRSILATFAVTAVSATSGTISVNFSGPETNMHIGPTSPAGIHQSLHWNNTDAAAGTLADLTNDTGSKTSATIVWNSKTIWHDSSSHRQALSGNSHAQIVSRYLDDSPQEPSVEIKVSHIPYGNYSVTLYLATGSSGGTYLPFKVNGKSYSTEDSKKLFKENPQWNKTNTITIKNLTGDLIIDGAARNHNARGSIAAIQIISSGPMKLTAPILGIGGITVILKDAAKK